MFSNERLIDECRRALREDSPEKAIREICARTISARRPSAHEPATPKRSEIITLHRSPDLTILDIIWGPGMTIYPHDHRMWAVIGVYEGCEDNTFFRRTPDGIVAASARRIEAGETAVLGAQTIHAVTNPLGQCTCALQIYGGDFFAVERSEFDPVTLEERPFDIEKAKSVFLAANRAMSA